MGLKSAKEERYVGPRVDAIMLWTRQSMHEEGIKSGGAQTSICQLGNSSTSKVRVFPVLTPVFERVILT